MKADAVDEETTPGRRAGGGQAGEWGEEAGEGKNLAELDVL